MHIKANHTQTCHDIWLISVTIIELCDGNYRQYSRKPRKFPISKDLSWNLSISLGAKYLTRLNYILSCVFHFHGDFISCEYLERSHIFSLLTPLPLKPLFRHGQIHPNSVTHPLWFVMSNGIQDKFQDIPDPIERYQPFRRNVCVIRCNFSWT